MTMSVNEKMLAEAIASMFGDMASLGISPTKNDDVSHLSQFKYEDINELFASKITKLVHFEPICAAFRKVHSYKYIDDPLFSVAFEHNLKSMAVPANEMAASQKAWLKMVEELMDEIGDERSAGFHPDLDEIQKVSKPPQAGEEK